MYLEYNLMEPLEIIIGMFWNIMWNYSLEHLLLEIN